MERCMDCNSLLTKEEKVDRKSTRLNSSHSQISYAVFCLKKKKTVRVEPEGQTFAQVPHGAQPGAPTLLVGVRDAHLGGGRHLQSVRLPQGPLLDRRDGGR